MKVITRVNTRDDKLWESDAVDAKDSLFQEFEKSVQDMLNAKYLCFIVTGDREIRKVYFNPCNVVAVTFKFIKD